MEDAARSNRAAHGHGGSTPSGATCLRLGFGTLAEREDAAGLNPAGSTMRVRLSRVPHVGRSFQLVKTSLSKSDVPGSSPGRPACPASVAQWMSSSLLSCWVWVRAPPDAPDACACSSVGSERHPAKVEAGGSSPPERALCDHLEQRRLLVRRARLLNGMWSPARRFNSCLLRSAVSRPSARLVSVVELVNTPDCGSGEHRFEPGQTPTAGLSHGWTQPPALFVYGLG